jgi:hypothetical protein
VKADKSIEKGNSAQNRQLKISTDIKVKRIKMNAPESDTKYKIVENVFLVLLYIFLSGVEHSIMRNNKVVNTIEVVKTCTIDSFFLHNG